MVGHWVREGAFFVPSFLLFACFTCIRPVYSCALFAFFFNTISYLSKKIKCVCVYSQVLNKRGCRPSNAEVHDHSKNQIKEKMAPDEP